MIKLLSKLPKPIAYAFGGGGSFGSIQVGQLRALARTDIQPDFVVGTSVGSLNATIVAETPDTAADRLGAFWSLVTRNDVFGSVQQMMLNLSLLRQGVADPTPLREMLERSTPSRDFADLELPLVAVATDVESGDLVTLQEGDLISALMASVAIPGVFPFVEREGRQLMDGGILSNVPIGVAAELGAETIVVLDCGFNLFAPATHPTLPHALLRAIALMSTVQVKRDLQHYADRTILYVPAKWPPGIMPYDFGRSIENNAESYSIAFDWLKQLKIKGRGVYGEPPDAARIHN